MFNLVLAVHILLCLVLVGLVLLQQGKGASAGALMGGSSNTLFGASGANSLITKVTTGIAIAFMVTSIALVKFYGGGNFQAAASDPLAGSVMAKEVAPAVDSAVSNSANVENKDLPSESKEGIVNEQPAAAPVGNSEASQPVEPAPAAQN